MNQQIIETIQLSTHGSASGAMSFPEVVQSLMSVGVSHYHVDFLRAEKTCYLRSGESLVESVPRLAGPVGQEFSSQDLKSAIVASQTEGQPFSEFCVRARAAGCIGYVAYLDGRRVIYTSRLGEEHIELFPS